MSTQTQADWDRLHGSQYDEEERLEAEAEEAEREKAEKEYWKEYEEMKANQSQYQHLRLSPKQ